MTRTTFAATLLLVAVLSLCSSRMAFAGPTEGPSAAMRLDKVADGLRQYHQQKAEGKRVAWLKRLAPSRDPRVFETLKAALSDSSKAVAWVAFELLGEHYGGPRPSRPPPPRLIPPPRPSGPPET